MSVWYNLNIQPKTYKNFEKEFGIFAENSWQPKRQTAKKAGQMFHRLFLPAGNPYAITPIKELSLLYQHGIKNVFFKPVILLRTFV